MILAKSGDKVRVQYIGRLNDGTVFDSTPQDQPMEFTLGDRQLIPGFEAAVIGMQVGEKRESTIPFDQAYGIYQEEMVFDIAKTSFPEDITCEVGSMVEIVMPNGYTLPVMIKKITPEQVTLDANHPLAGKDLIFEIRLLEIVTS